MEIKKIDLPVGLWSPVFYMLVISTPLIFAYYHFLAGAGFPGLHWDASLYSTVIINVARGRNWTFDSFAWAIVGNPNRDYIGHGFLSIFFHGELFKADSWDRLEQQFVWVNTVSYVVWFFVLSVARDRTWVQSTKAALSAFLVSYMTMCLQGRPEHLSAMLLAPSAYLWLSGCRDVHFHICWAVTAGLLFCASPALGLLSAVFTIVLIGADTRKRGKKNTILCVIQSGGLSIAIAVALIGALQPFDVFMWLSGTIHGSRVAPDLSPFFFSLGRPMLMGLSVMVPFWNLITIAAMVCGGWILMKERAFLLLAVFIFFCVQCFLRVTDYGVISMFPMLMAFVQAASTQHLRGNWIRVARASVMVAWLGAAVLTMEGANAILHSESTRENAVHRINEMCGADTVVAYHMNFRPSLVSVRLPSLRYVGTIPSREADISQDAFYRSLEAVIGRHVEWFVYPQTYRGTPPSTIFLGTVGYELVFSDWTRDHRRIMGIRVLGGKPGFQIAIYQRRAIVPDSTASIIP